MQIMFFSSSIKLFTTEYIGTSIPIQILQYVMYRGALSFHPDT